MFVFLIVVVSLACGSAPPRSVALASIVASLAALVSLWTLLARSAADRAIADVDRGGRIALATEQLQRQLERLRWAAIAGAVVGLLGFGLAGAVQTWPYFSQSMVLQTVVLLAPAHLLIAATLWAERRFDGAVGRAAVGFPAMARDVIAALARLDGWMIAPILVLLGLADLLGLVPAPYAPSAGAALAVVTLLCVPVLVPWVTKRLWRTRSLPPEHRWIIEQVAAAGAPRLDVRWWDTGLTSANAVVVGFFPRFRSLLLTDRIVRELSPPQLKLIVLHEVAHILRGHVWLRLLAVTPGWLAAAAVIHRWGTDPAVLVLSNVAAITVTLVLLRLVAHRTELDADRTACELALRLDAVGRPASSGDARTVAECLGETLRSMSRSGGGSRRASWLHPSVDARCARLLAWAEQQAAEQRPRAERVDRAAFRPAPFSNRAIQPILCRSVAATPAAESLNLEKIDESNRCDYVQR